MKRTIIFISLILFFLMIIIGTLTYVYLYKDYDTKTNCLIITYGINVKRGTSKINTLMPSSITIKDGLKTGIKIKLKDECLQGTTANLILHINKETNQLLTTTSSSYCKIDSSKNTTLTKELCNRSGGTWFGLNDYYCENPQSLERMGKYLTYNNCIKNNGSWTQPESPLRYAVYDSENEESLPYTFGKIYPEDIGKDITISSEMPINDPEKQYYIYIWLDKNVIDSTYEGLTFDATLSVKEIKQG